MAGRERDGKRETQSEETEMTQTTQILSALKRGEKLTPLQALRKYGCMRLAARIKDLRDAGHDINTTVIRTQGARVARYSL